MAVLAFHIQADYERVIRLRQEIERLETRMQSFTKSTPQAEIEQTNQQMALARSEFARLTTAAAQAGAAIDNDFRLKLRDSEITINALTKRVMEQKAWVADTAADVRRLADAYKEASKTGWGANDKLAELKAAKAALAEDKAALFDLTQKQAEARLSAQELSQEYRRFRQQAGETAKEVGQLKDETEQLADKTDDQADIISGVAAKMRGTMAGLFGVQQLSNFISKMTQVRSQFQAADTAMQTMLGSKAKADALMAQVRDFAKVSPLEFADVTQATQMMLGFNIEAAKVPRFLQAIGDISVGDTQKFNSLTLAFSQMSASGKLMGQDLNQMINAGFNPLQQMSETTGKSIAELKDEMSKGAITAGQVQQAFIDATSEGGRFYNMSANASKTIQGQISMLDDAVDMAYNDIGEKLEGTITGAIQAATYLVENYQTVAKVVIALATAYGTYRAALLLTAAVEKSRKVIAADEQKQVAGINSRTAAIEAEIAKRRELIEVMKGERKEQDAELLKTPDKGDNRSPLDKAGDAEKDAKARLQAVNQEIEARYQAARQAKAQADQSLQTAQADLAAKREALQTARQENELAQRGLTAAQSAKQAADERVKSAREYLDTLKEAADYDGSGQGGSDDQQSAADEMAAAVKEQLAAANEVETATEHANTASKNLNTAATAEQAAVTRVQTATEAQSTAAATLHTAATARREHPTR